MNNRIGDIKIEKNYVKSEKFKLFKVKRLF